MKWEMVRLGDLALEVRNGISSRPEGDTGTRILRISSVRPASLDLADTRWLPDDYGDQQTYRLQQDDLLFTRYNGNAELVGVCARVRVLPAHPVLYPDKLIRVRLDVGRANPAFIEHVVHSTAVRAQLNQFRKTSAGQVGIAGGDLQRLMLPLPPLNEQHRIADILDQADALRRKRREAIALCDELVRATFLEMFGDPVTNPKGWSKQSVRSVCTDVQYGTSQKANEEARGPVVLRMNNLTSNGAIDLGDIKWVELSAGEQAALELADGDVLFNRTNSPELVGKTAMWRSIYAAQPVVFAGYLVRLRANPAQVRPMYLATAMNMSGTKRVLRSMAKVAINMANISASDLHRIEIAIPPPELQEQFEDRANALFLESRRISAPSSDLDALFASLQHRAFRGEL